MWLGVVALRGRVQGIWYTLLLSVMRVDAVRGEALLLHWHWSLHVSVCWVVAMVLLLGIPVWDRGCHHPLLLRMLLHLWTAGHRRRGGHVLWIHAGRRGSICAGLGMDGSLLWDCRSRLRLFFEFLHLCASSMANRQARPHAADDEQTGDPDAYTDTNLRASTETRGLFVVSTWETEGKHSAWHVVR